MPNPRRKKDYDLYNPQLSIHTRITYIAGMVCIGVLLYLGFRHIGDSDAAGQRFGFVTLLEGGFALIALLLTDTIRDHGLFPRPFRSLHEKFLKRVLIIFAGIAAIQFIFIMIPLTARDLEIGLAIVFASVAEELFFRAFFISIAVRFGHDDRNKIDLPQKKRISFIEIGIVILSSIAFALIHVNYYSDMSLMLTVFFGGLWLGFMYWWTRDLTAVMIAHFLLNTMVVIQSIFIVNL